MIVELDRWETMYPALIGAIMETVSNFDNRKSGSAIGQGYSNHIWGAIGEMVVAKAFDVYWNGNINGLKSPDVGELQVRHTPSDTGLLTLNQWGSREDNPEDTFFLVVGTGPYRIAGWIPGEIALARDERGKLIHYRDHFGKGRPCVGIPQELLKPLIEYPDLPYHLRETLEAQTVV
jgi:hypothetical protein